MTSTSYHKNVMHGIIRTAVCTHVSAVPLPTDVKAVQANISQLRDQFDSLRTAAQHELEKAQVCVKFLLNKLFDLPAAVSDLHQDFLMNYEKY